MLILAAVCALLLGWCTGGRLSRFEGAGLRLLPLPVASLLLQRALGLVPPAHYPVLAPVLLLCSYALLFCFLWRNRHLKKTALFMGTGSLCNLLVIAANGWRMPVSPAASAALSPDGLAQLASGAIPMYTLAQAQTRLLFLGDIFYCPLPLLRGFASVGDLLLMAGVAFCLLAVMAPTRLPGWARGG